MTQTLHAKTLITGATGQVGGRTIDHLTREAGVEIIAAVRSPEKAAGFVARGMAARVLDLDRDATHLPALEGIERLFLVTGYTVDMLRQSKVLLDNARKAGVRHVVHLGACGPDDTTVAHWAWHQLVERYIEWSGFSYTHLRPENFMQNVLGYGGKPAIHDGVLNGFIAGARLSWVDVDDVAEMAALALARPDLHGGQTWRLGSEAAGFAEIAALMTRILGRPFRYEPLDPEVFRQAMREAGAEMAYMDCVYEHWKRYAAGTIPGADETFDTFRAVTGRAPAGWAAFIERHRDVLLQTFEAGSRPVVR